MPSSTKWRIYIIANGGDSYHTIAEITMAASAGGSNLCTGGTATSSTNFSGQPASQAFDGNTSTSWSSGGGAWNTPEWIAYEFPSAQSVVEYSVRALAGFGYRAPREFLLQYYDGASWVAVDDRVEVPWGSGESRTFSVGRPSDTRGGGLRTAQKPWLGTGQLQTAHPLAEHLALYVLANEQAVGLYPEVVHLAGLPHLPISGGVSGTAFGDNPGWTSNVDGRAVALANASLRLTGGAGGDWLKPSDAGVTLCFIRRKVDTTNRQAQLFTGQASGTATTDVYYPYDDGVTYWDYGGTSSPNRLTASGLAFSIRRPDRAVFTAGPRGSAIWHNGVKVASQATALTATAIDSSKTYHLNLNASQRDVIDLNYFAAYYTQWDDALCRWWSAEPYAHFYPAITRTYQFLSAVAGGGAFRPTTYYAQQRQQAS